MPNEQFCDAQTLADLADAIRGEDDRILQRLDDAISSWPDDARLYFLRGSVRASMRNYADAVHDMEYSLAIDPGSSIVRFQLGFLKLSCGDVPGAKSSWSALQVLAADDPLRLLSEGLTLLVDDDLARGIAILRAGMSANSAHPEINDNIALILDRLAAENGPASGSPPPDTEAPEVIDMQNHLLLSGYWKNTTKH